MKDAKRLWWVVRFWGPWGFAPNGCSLRVSGLGLFAFGFWFEGVKIIVQGPLTRRSRAGDLG